jgi:hypothetical protein
MATQSKSSGSGSGSGSGSSKSSGGSSGSRSGSRSRGSGNGSAPAQTSRSRSRSATGPSAEDSEQPDVLLDVPQLKVEELGLEADNLHAQVALEARLGELLHIHVGVDVVTDRIAVEMKGVDAQAQLTARLDQVLSIIERTLKTVDAHPEVLTELAPAESEADEKSSAKS